MNRPFLILGLLIASSIYGDGSRPLVYGAEVEISERQLANFVDIFDLDNSPIDITAISDAVTRDLMLEPNALDKIPQTVRAELTKDLDLQPLEFASPISEKDHLTAEKNQKLEIKTRGEIQAKKESSLIIPGQERPNLEANPIEVPKLFVPESARVIPKDKAWQELNSRWNKIPASVRALYVRPNELSRMRKAKLVIEQYAKKQKHSTRADEPKDPLKLKFMPGQEDLLKDFSWSKDAGNVLEFRHKPPIQGKEEFLQSLKNLLRLAGNEQLVLKPSEHMRFDSSLHIHISAPHWPVESQEGVEFQSKLKDYIKLKIFNDGLPITTVSRFPAANHAEVRVWLDVEKDLAEYSKLFEAASPSEALAQLQQLKNKLDPDRLMRMFKAQIRKSDFSAVNDFLSTFLKTFPEKADLLHATTIEILKENRVNIEIARALWVNLNNLNYNEGHNKFDKAVWDLIIDRISKPQEELLFKIIANHQSEWPEKLWEIYPDLIRGPHQQHALGALEHQTKNFPDAVWREISKCLQSKDRFTFGTAKAAIANQKERPSWFTDAHPSIPIAAHCETNYQNL